MSYTPTVYVDGQAPDLSATNLNHNENGLQAAAAVADAAVPAPASKVTNGAVVWNGSAWVDALLVNANIDPAAAIARSKLDFGSGLVNADIASAAAIVGSKLATGLTGPPGAEIAYQSFTVPVTLATTSEGTATTVVTAPSFTGDAATAVWLEFWCPYVLLNTATNWSLEFFDGSTGIGGLMTVSLAQTIPFHLRLKVTPSAASKTYSVRGWVTGTANASVGAGVGGAATNLPGLIRIVKA